MLRAGAHFDRRGRPAAQSAPGAQLLGAQPYRVGARRVRAPAEVALAAPEGCQAGQSGPPVAVDPELGHRQLRQREAKPCEVLVYRAARPEVTEDRRIDLVVAIALRIGAVDGAHVAPAELAQDLAQVLVVVAVRLVAMPVVERP